MSTTPTSEIGESKRDTSAGVALGIEYHGDGEPLEDSTTLPAPRPPFSLTHPKGDVRLAAMSLDLESPMSDVPLVPFPHPDFMHTSPMEMPPSASEEAIPGDRGSITDIDEAGDKYLIYTVHVAQPRYGSPYDFTFIANATWHEGDTVEVTDERVGVESSLTEFDGVHGKLARIHETETLFFIPEDRLKGH